MVWHRMRYSCNHMATVGVKMLSYLQYCFIECLLYGRLSSVVQVQVLHVITDVLTCDVAGSGDDRSRA